jgi:hypothetical protein
MHLLLSMHTLKLKETAHVRNFLPAEIGALHLLRAKSVRPGEYGSNSCAFHLNLVS